MELKDFKQRNIAPGYIFFEGEAKPENGWESFKRVLKRSIKGELFVGLWIVFREMIRFDIHTVQYPAEKLEMGPRYRAIHKLLRLLCVWACCVCVCVCVFCVCVCVLCCVVLCCVICCVCCVWR